MALGIVGGLRLFRLLFVCGLGSASTGFDWWCVLLRLVLKSAWRGWVVVQMKDFMVQKHPTTMAMTDEPTASLPAVTPHDTPALGSYMKPMTHTSTSSGSRKHSQ